jgi:hypothetical protein
VADAPDPKAELDALASIVRTEGHRVLSDVALAADPTRLADGWERRFIADGRRAAEAVELYESLGFEAVADPVKADPYDADCADCQVVMALQFKTVYTRPRKDPAP